MPTEHEERIRFSEALPGIAGRMREVEVAYDASRAMVVTTLRYRERPSFSAQQLRDYRTLYDGLRAHMDGMPYGTRPVRYLAHTSGEPGAWCLGGDLDLFSRCIREGDAETLRSYGHDCARVGYDTHVGLGLSVITLCLIQGMALGGGLESARSCNVVIAEEQSTFSLPEIKFNLFPGMGALSYLAHRTGMPAAERMMLTGETRTAAEMLAMDGIDLVVPEGTGRAALDAYVDEDMRRHSAHSAILAARQRARPITYDEVRDIVDIWVECAMRVSEADLRMMERLVSAQHKLRARRSKAA